MTILKKDETLIAGSVIVKNTLKSRIQDVEDWIETFNAVMRLKPNDVPIAATIDHSFAIRDAANGTISRLEKKFEEKNRQRTLCIIKPDAVSRNLTGYITDILEDNDLRVIKRKETTLTLEEAKKFYIVHESRPFYDELCEFMISGPVVVQVLEGDNAVLKYREIMGSTDPKEAQPNTIRHKFAGSKRHNCVHGSDSLENAGIEISFFFGDEI